jgi:hypothetical protein
MGAGGTMAWLFPAAMADRLDAAPPRRVPVHNY